MLYMTFLLQIGESEMGAVTCELKKAVNRILPLFTYYKNCNLRGTNQSGHNKGPLPKHKHLILKK